LTWSRLQERFRNLMTGLARFVDRTPLTPNAITVLGSALNLIPALLIALDYHLWAGVILLPTTALDSLDGALARLQGSASRFGAFLDSVLDRYVEIFFFAGLSWHYAQAPDHWGVFGALLAIGGSLMVSYCRARAEGLGVACKVGYLQRPERLLILGLALILAVLVADWILLTAVWVLAVVTNFTALQRILHVRRVTG
jgi:CDP-diacylglycerol--glycerol-3-phosphate 3-phosphatidyltransferase